MNRLPASLQRLCLEFVPAHGITPDQLKQQRARLTPQGSRGVYYFMRGYSEKMCRVVHSERIYAILPRKLIWYQACYVIPHRERWYLIASTYQGQGWYENLYIDATCQHILETVCGDALMESTVVPFDRLCFL